MWTRQLNRHLQAKNTRHGLIIWKAISSHFQSRSVGRKAVKLDRLGIIPDNLSDPVKDSILNMKMTAMRLYYYKFYLLLWPKGYGP